MKLHLIPTMRRALNLFCLSILLAALLLGAPPARPAAAEMDLPPSVQNLSVSADGTLSDGWSIQPAISADGSTAAFVSDAGNLVAWDHPHTWDLFLKDLNNGQIVRATNGVNHTLPNGPASYWSPPSLSLDGSLVAFASLASNLVEGDANATCDVFVYDRSTGQTERISNGVKGNPADGWSDWPSISADGRYVAFTSLATNLVEGFPGGRGIYVYDRQTRRTELVSTTLDGTQSETGWSSAISADGRYVAFSSPSGSLVQGDTNGDWDVFVRDRDARQTIRVSVTEDGKQADGPSGKLSRLGISADGKRVVFTSQANNLTGVKTKGRLNVYWRDWQAGITRLLSLGRRGGAANGDCSSPTLSMDGRFAAAACQASNLVRLDDNHAWDVFLFDAANQTSWLVSTSSIRGASASGDSGLWGGPAISVDGRKVVYASSSGALTNPERKGYWDVYETSIDLQRMARIVFEAYTDTGMPYCTVQAAHYRGCPGGYNCGAPFHGWTCGVCSDLIIDAYSWGGGFDLQKALVKDLAGHPDHVYLWNDVRHVHDMYLYFLYTDQLFAPGESYQRGDVVFFDWNNDGLVEHAALVADVTGDGRPRLLVNASGPLESNPSGAASEILWQGFHEQGVKGHARLGGVDNLWPALWP